MTAQAITSPLHKPVMRDWVLRQLSPNDGETFLDGTFGAGGYSEAILEAADCSVYGIDRDPEAVLIGRDLEHSSDGRFTILEGRFSEMEDLLGGVGVSELDGIALDVGMSSMQLDNPERGFSFQADGPLNMRMDSMGETAADVINTRAEMELVDIFQRLGEEPRALRVAKAIIKVREIEPILRTSQLADIIVGALGHGKRKKKGRYTHPATRVFQALRIYVNEELKELSNGLNAAERLLKEGGRLCVVSFHSLEDRIVKKFLAARGGLEPRGSRHIPDAPSPVPNPTFHLPRRGVQKPTAEEIGGNPRARSARLRSAVRTGASPWSGEDCSPANQRHGS